MSRKLSVVSTLLVLSFLPCSPAPARAQGGAEIEERVTWYYYEEEAPGTEELRFSCGRYGSFEVSRAPANRVGSPASKLGCKDPKAAACGVEAPWIYPSPALVKKPEAPEKIQAAAPVWVPCDDGLCFSDVSSINTGASWIAVIDWSNQHGWSVGWMIRHLSSTESTSPSVVLFPLYDDELLPFSLLGATDLHVLKKLCEVAEIADLHDAPPLVVNMSFGRLRNEGDPDDAGTCDTHTLSCHVARVLHHLTCAGEPCDETPVAPKTVPVAAAGNHGVPQFPAALPGVVAAGSLQLALYRDDGQIDSSWETPKYGDKAQAWVPGYGICLEEGGREWPAPPGSSYATAFFSGWIGALLARQPIEAPFMSKTWFPTFDGQTYALVHGDRRYDSHPTLDRFLDRLLRSDRPPCRSIAAPEQQIQRLGRKNVPSPLTGTLSLIEALDLIARSAKQPAPMDRPCVPCIGVDTSRPPEDRQAAKLAQSPGLVIDRRGSAESAILSRFPDLLASGIPVTLKNLYLRLGEKFFELRNDQSGWIDPADAEIQRFSISQIEIGRGTQPSLVYLYSLDELRFWSSVPVLVSP